MIDLVALINDTHLQFLSIFLSAEQSSWSAGTAGAPVDGARERSPAGAIRVGELLQNLSSLVRLELRVNLREQGGLVADKQEIRGTLLKLPLQRATFAQQTKLKRLKLAGELDFSPEDVGAPTEPASGQSPFAPLRQLEHLSLEFGGLNAFPLYLHFHPANNNSASLSSLSLAHNKLECVERDLFGQPVSATNGTAVGAPERQASDLLLASLTQLDLSDNRLCSFNPSAGRLLMSAMPKLTQLYLQRNRIVHLHLNDLLAVQPSGAPVDGRPTALARAGTKLEHLDVSENKLERLIAFAPVRHTDGPVRLKFINLSGNRLLRPLELLDAKTTQQIFIRELQTNVRQMPHLRDLERWFSFAPKNATNSTLCDLLSPPQALDSVQLDTELDEELISELILSGNNIQFISQTDLASRQCRRLQTLRLADNRIRRLHPFALNELTNLDALDLSDNLLDELSELTFARTTKVRVLNLSGNRIRSLPSVRLFNRLSELEKLALSHNQLIYLAGDLFASNRQLTELDLSSNELAQVSSSLLWPLSRQLRMLNLQANQLGGTFHAGLVEQTDKHSSAPEPADSAQRQSAGKPTSAPARHQPSGRTNKRPHKRQLATGADQIGDEEDELEGAQTVTSLLLSQNLLEVFKFDKCTSMFARNLADLWLDRNRLSHLDANTFKCLNRLRNIRLARNRISSIGPQTFAHLAHLELLDLSANQIAHLHSSTFQLSATNSPELKQVQTRARLRLELNDNQLTYMNVGEMFASSGGLARTLERLNVCDNPKLRLENIEDFLETPSWGRNFARQLQLCNIGELSAVSTRPANKLANEIHLSLLDLSAIRRLEFATNSSLFSLLTSKRLTVEHLKMNHFHPPSSSLASSIILAQVSAESRLTELQISANQMDNKQFQQLILKTDERLAIDVLNLSANSIDRWPINSRRAGERLASLRSLDLSGNKIKHLIDDSMMKDTNSAATNLSAQQTHQTAWSLPELSRLNLSGNAIVDLVQVEFAQLYRSRESKEFSLASFMPALECLDLSYNRITWLPSGLFDYLVRLTEVSLAHNQLERLALIPFGPRVSGRLSLELSANFMLALDAGHSSDLQSLQFEDSSSFEDLDENVILLADPAGGCKGIEELVRVAISGRHEKNEQPAEAKCSLKQDALDQLSLDSLGRRATNLSSLVSFAASLGAFRRPLSLRARWNSLTRLSEGPADLERVRQALANLIQLDVSNNRLRNDAVGEREFCSAAGGRLRSLSVAHNQLAWTPLSSLANCSRLTHLDLSNNRIAGWSEGLLVPKSLRVLVLAHNALSSLAPQLLLQLNHLSLLDLRHNRLQTDWRPASLARHLAPGAALVWLAEGASGPVELGEPERALVSLSEETLELEWRERDHLRPFSVRQLDESASVWTAKQASANKSSTVVKFCALKPNKLTQICLTIADNYQLEDLDESACLYLQTASKLSSCLTQLHPANDSTTTLISSSTEQRQVRQLAPIGATENGRQTHSDDLVLQFIEMLKHNWIKLRDFSPTEYLANKFAFRPAGEQNELVGSATSENTLNLIKLAIVGGSVSIVALLIAMFTLLTCQSNAIAGKQPDRPTLESPLTGSELASQTTVKTNTTLTQNTSTCTTSASGSTSAGTAVANEKRLSDCSSLGQTRANFSSSASASSTGSSTVISGRRQRYQRAAINERAASEMATTPTAIHQAMFTMHQLDAQQLQQNCPTPTSSLAPSSVAETAETTTTLNAVDSIHSCTTTSLNSQLQSADQFQNNIYDQQLAYAPVATVMRMVKSNSAGNFERTPTNPIIRGRQLMIPEDFQTDPFADRQMNSNYATMRGRVRAFHHQQQQRQQMRNFHPTRVHPATFDHQEMSQPDGLQQANYYQANQLATDPGQLTRQPERSLCQMHQQMHLQNQMSLTGLNQIDELEGFEAELQAQASANFPPPPNSRVIEALEQELWILQENEQATHK